MNLTFQYIVVGLILVATAVYIIVKLISLRKKAGNGGSGGCCGCALSDTCNPKEIKEKPSNKDCHENNKDLEQ